MMRNGGDERMKWPWQRRSEGNRHQWQEEPGKIRRIVINKPIRESVWRCRQCGKAWPSYLVYNGIVPPAYGCSALPIPAPPRGEQDTGLPVVATGGEG